MGLLFIFFLSDFLPVVPVCGTLYDRGKEWRLKKMGCKTGENELRRWKEFTLSSSHNSLISLSISVWTSVPWELKTDNSSDKMKGKKGREKKAREERAVYLLLLFFLVRFTMERCDRRRAKGQIKK